MSSRHGHTINPATISRWLTAHPDLTTYRRLRGRGLKLFNPVRIIRTVKLYHRQVYEFSYHRAKLAFLREGTLDDRRRGDMCFAPLADFIERVPQICPHDLFRREDAARGSQLAPGFLALERLVVTEKQNIATDTAALIIPSVGSNYDRQPKLQRFMLANDSSTLAVEVPIWLNENDIVALEEMYGVAIVPKQQTPLTWDDFDILSRPINDTPKWPTARTKPSEAFCEEQEAGWNGEESQSGVIRRDPQGIPVRHRDDQRGGAQARSAPADGAPGAGGCEAARAQARAEAAASGRAPDDIH